MIAYLPLLSSLADRRGSSMSVLFLLLSLSRDGSAPVCLSARKGKEREGYSCTYLPPQGRKRGKEVMDPLHETRP